MSWENLFRPYVNNKGADQPAHPYSLMSAFVVRCLDSIIPLLAIAKISRLQLVSVAAQAGLCLTWLQTPEDRFSHDKALIIPTSSKRDGLPNSSCSSFCTTIYKSRLRTKPTKWHVHPVKTQISLGLHPVWSESSLSAWWQLESLATHSAYSWSDLADRLIWVFAGSTVILFVLSCCGSQGMELKEQLLSNGYECVVKIYYQTPRH